MIEQIPTPYGPGLPQGYDPDKGAVLVTIARKDLTRRPDNDRGGPCVFVWVSAEKEIAK